MSNILEVTCRRKALTSFTFSNGLIVNSGVGFVYLSRRWCMTRYIFESPRTLTDFDSQTRQVLLVIICEIQKQAGWRIHRLTKWCEASERLPSEHSIRKPSKGEDIFHDWYVCSSGRFYASTIMKLIMAKILQKYDCSLHNAQSSRKQTWRSSIISRSSIVVIFRVRQRKARD